jgi:hypothetical protein
MKIQTLETSGICKHVHACFHSNHWIKHETNEKKMRISLFRGYVRIICFAEARQEAHPQRRIGV